MLDANATVTAQVPSNIALIKYWGKRDPDSQWAANDSLSMTLSAAHTITHATAHDSTQDVLVRKPYAAAGTLSADLNPARGEAFTASTPGAASALGPGLNANSDKALKHLTWLRQELGFHRRLFIETTNSFPSDCGIASSASGLGALTLAAVAAWTGAGSLIELEVMGYPRQRLASLARRGSGSACRSFAGGYVHWESGLVQGQQQIRELAAATHWPLADVIVIVSAAPKRVSSTVAHQAAWTSPLFAPRLAGLPARLRVVQKALVERDLELLGDAIEAEALEMHAVMMTSAPAVCYLTEDTSRFLVWLRRERERGLPAYFTIDAGANPHVICERAHATWVLSRIRHEFPGWDLLLDGVGEGPMLSRRAPL